MRSIRIIWKKKKLFFGIIISTTSLQAQITVTQSSNPVPGDVITVYEDNQTQPGLTITPAGPNQNWDYSAGWNITDTTVMHFMPPAGQPGANLFPSANLSALVNYTSGPFSEIQEYFNTSSSMLSVLGFYLNNSTVNTVGTLTNGNQFHWPINYGDTVNYSNIQSIVQIYTSGSPFAYKQVSYRSGKYIVDAWGNLTGPLGIQPVLRYVDDISTSIDSIFIDNSGTGQQFVLNSVNTALPGTIDYTFISNTSYATVMALKGNRITGDIRYYSYSDHSTAAAIKALNLNNISLYPNPAKGMVTMRNNAGQSALFELFNAAGVKVFEYNLNNIDVLSIETSGFANGLYMYRMSGRDGSTPLSGKLMIEN